ncbi:MAG: amidohydrolase family protein [Clostridia bacterium]|nr:amidohydrolase family protein [Clostridia bacterium]
MRKIIDLCLDMPMGAAEIASMLSAMCLDPSYRGYKKSYGAGVAKQIGLTIDEIDRVYAEGGKEAFLALVNDAAEKNAVTQDEFIRHLDDIGIEWGITVDGNHDNRKTAEIVRAHPDKLKGFIFVDPNKGEQAVRELETCVKEYGLHALYLTAFRTHLTADDPKNYPLYAKCIELGIPVHIYSSLNLSKAVPYDIGHPRYIDKVARDFPELKIMAGVSGWPWVLDFLALAMRHENLYLNFETHAPEKMAQRGSGYEPYLYYGERNLKERICFASNWGTQSIPVEDLVAQVEALPFSDSAKDNILYNNAKTFYEELCAR